MLNTFYDLSTTMHRQIILSIIFTLICCFWWVYASTPTQTTAQKQQSTVQLMWELIGKVAEAKPMYFQWVDSDFRREYGPASNVVVDWSEFYIPKVVWYFTWSDEMSMQATDSDTQIFGVVTKEMASRWRKVVDNKTNNERRIGFVKDGIFCSVEHFMWSSTIIMPQWNYATWFQCANKKDVDMVAKWQKPYVVAWNKTNIEDNVDDELEVKETIYVHYNKKANLNTYQYGKFTSTKASIVGRTHARSIYVQTKKWLIHIADFINPITCKDFDEIFKQYRSISWYSSLRKVACVDL